MNDLNNSVDQSADNSSLVDPSASLEPRRTAGYFDWRIVFALSVTSVWLVGGMFYISSRVGLASFFQQPIESVGSFLEGAFAPLAFLWLVVGYFLQQQALSRNTEAIEQQHVEMRKASAQAEMQAQAIRANAVHTRQQTFMQLYEVVKRSLGGVVGLLYISSQLAPDIEKPRVENIGDLWQEMTDGDHELFARKFMQIAATEEPDFSDLFYGTDVRRRHAENFMLQFERILVEARACDPSGVIFDAVSADSMGRFYEMVVAYRP